MKKIIYTLMIIVICSSIGYSSSWKNFLSVENIKDVVHTGQYTFIVTYGGGMVRIDNSTGKYHVFHKANSGLPTNFLTSVEADNEGNIWIGTSWMGLVKFDGTNWETINVNNSQLPSNLINTVRMVDDVMMVGTNDGLAVLDDGNMQIYNTSNSGLPSNQVTTISNPGDEYIAFGTTAGLTLFNYNEWFTVPGVPNDEITSVSWGFKGYLWVGTLNNGVGAWYPGGEWTPYNTKNSNLPSDQVNSLDLLDDELWV